MSRSILFLFVGILLTVIPSAIFAQANPFQGVYAGRLRVWASSRGFQPYLYPSRMVVLPDGHSILLTAQLPNSVASWSIKGSFAGNLFEGFSRGRVNTVNYTWAMTYKIRFLRDAARIEQKAVNPPTRLVDDPNDRKAQIFYRIRS